MIPRVLCVFPKARTRRVRSLEHEPLPVEPRLRRDEHRVPIPPRHSVRDAQMRRRRARTARRGEHVRRVLRDAAEAARDLCKGRQPQPARERRLRAQVAEEPQEQRREQALPPAARRNAREARV